MEFIDTYPIQIKDLQASLLFVAKRDVRFYLTGVFVGKGMISATNGFLVLICDEPAVKEIELIIPSAVVKSFISKMGTKRDLEVNLSKIDDDFWLLHHRDCYELFKPIDGKYPDVTRIDMPKPESYESKQFPHLNFDYLMLFHKASAIYLKIPSPKIYPTSPNGNAYMEINDRVHGVISPMRNSDYDN